MIVSPALAFIFFENIKHREKFLKRWSRMLLDELQGWQLEGGRLERWMGGWVESWKGTIVRLD